MAERGTNFYYPPDFDPKIHRSANGYQGVHHLRERARKIDQGIIIIRFEMPFNIWCEGCNNHIGMGVRYNAQKTRVGMYYSTIIYKFRMKCHLCDNHFEIQTDPKRLDYEIICGARRQERRWNPQDNEQITPLDGEDATKKATNAMYRLEHEASDRKKLEEKLPTLERIQKMNSRMRDDYDWNCRLRKSFRTDKKLMKEQEAKDAAICERAGLGIALLPEEQKDRQLASLIKLSCVERQSRESCRKKIMSQPLFGSQGGTRMKKIKNMLLRNEKNHTESRRPSSSDKIIQIDQEEKNMDGTNEDVVKGRCLPKVEPKSPTIPLPSFHSLLTSERKSTSSSPCTSSSSDVKAHNALHAICAYDDGDADVVSDVKEDSNSDDDDDDDSSSCE